MKFVASFSSRVMFCVRFDQRLGLQIVLHSTVCKMVFVRSLNVTTSLLRNAGLPRGDLFQ